jgi:hypothetical protein
MKGLFLGRSSGKLNGRGTPEKEKPVRDHVKRIAGSDPGEEEKRNV